MRLSTVFELLLIFLLIAFAAYGRVIEHNEVSLHRVTRATKQNFDVSFLSLKQATENVNRFCMCENVTCSCCGNFNIPLFILRDRPCVSIKYMDKNKMAVQFNIGNNLLTTRVITGDQPRAICVPMPGSITKFCGRIYSIKREEESDHFKACLGVELQSGKGSKIEAAIRVSCFRFGPSGIQLRPAEPLPLIESSNDEEDDDDDDYEDIFDLDDDSDESTPPKKPQSTEDDDDDDDDDEDILGFGSFLDLITGDDDSSKKKTTTASPPLPFTIPLLIKPTPSPTVASSPKPVDEIPLEIKKPTKMPELPITSPAITEVSETTDSADDSTTINEGIITDDSVPEAHYETTVSSDDKPEVEAEMTEATEVVTTVVSPLKTPEIKKIVGIKTVIKKPSNSPNAIVNYTKKPLVSPDPVNDSEEDDADYILASDSDEDDDETENVEETEVEDDDDEGEEEEEVLSAFVTDDDDDEETKDEKMSDNETSKPGDDDNDYGMNLEEFMARKRSARRQWTGRQSKVMRL